MQLKPPLSEAVALGVVQMITLTPVNVAGLLEVVEDLALLDMLILVH